MGIVMKPGGKQHNIKGICAPKNNREKMISEGFFEYRKTKINYMPANKYMIIYWKETNN